MFVEEMTWEATLTYGQASLRGGIKMDINQNDDFSKGYSEQSFWEKVLKYAKVAGLKVVYIALLLYHTLQNPEVPKWAKGVIIGALGYFIVPADALPDLIPGGYVDDLGALLFALLQVSMYINEEIKIMSKNKLQEWFGEIDQSQIDEVDKKINKKINKE